MDRLQKLKLNTLSSILNRIIRLVSGIILPRLIIQNYGSETNGLVTSVYQFLSVITFLDLGVGSVVESALYKPLADKYWAQISEIIVAAKNYFRKISYLLIIYIIILTILYPTFVNESLNIFSTAFLIFALSLSTFSQFYFGLVNELLLNADQKGYIQLAAETIVVVLNLLISIFLIYKGASIQVVKFFAGLIYLLRPLYLYYYVNKTYQIDYDIVIDKDPLPQKRSGMGQHIAYTIQTSSDVVLLTLFSTLENVSIYSVYKMVINAINLLLDSLTANITSFFGNLLASKEIELLNSYFSKFEWLLHTMSVYLFGMTAVLINQFINLYIGNIDGVNYYAPFFSIIFIISSAFNIIRIPYRRLIFASGHFKQTQKASFIEAGIKIVFSVMLISKWGLNGVAIGTLIAVSYHTIYLVYYNSNNIIYRSVSIFWKHMLVNLIVVFFMWLVFTTINKYLLYDTFLNWSFSALIYGVIYFIIIVIINLIFYKDITNYYYSFLKNKVTR